MDMAACETKEEIGTDVAAIDSAVAMLLLCATIHVNGDNMTHTDYLPSRVSKFGGNVELHAGDEESSNAGRPESDDSFEFSVVSIAEWSKSPWCHSDNKCWGDVYVTPAVDGA